MALPSTYLNDLTVDETRGVAYFVDAGADEPHALIRLDLETGASRRLLHNHRTVRAAASPRPGGIVVVGKPMSPHESVRIGATGITLGGAGSLFWNRADELFSIGVDVLAAGDHREIDAAITTWPVRDFASDGLDRDRSERILLTDRAHSGMQCLDPATGRYETLAADAALSWPDGVCAAPDASAYATSSQIHHSGMFSGTDTRQPPFGIYRLCPQSAVGLMGCPRG